MPLTRQAKVLDDVQVTNLLRHVQRSSYAAARNVAIVRLSFEAWLRATEIAGIRWRMLLDVSARLGPELRLEDVATKGRSGRVIPLSAGLAAALERLHRDEAPVRPDGFVVRFRKHSADRVLRSQAVQALFRDWYGALGFRGCSSHSGRRTGITKAARQVTHLGGIGGSLRDVQLLAGHSSIATTQKYIDPNPAVHRRLVELTAIRPVALKAGLPGRPAILAAQEVS